MQDLKKVGALGALGVALAAGLVLAPVAASAHVSVDTDGVVAAGGETTLTFGFNHGCDGSSTTAIEVSMPEGLSGVHPIAGGGWTIDVERGGDAGRVSTVTYTAATPVPGEVRGEAEMLVGIADDAPDSLVFPVEQVCEDGSISWSEVAADGEDPHDLEAPAPVLEIADPAGAPSDHAAASHEAATTDDGGDVWSLPLSGAAVVISLAAFGTAIARTRRRS